MLDVLAMCVVLMARCTVHIYAYYNGEIAYEAVYAHVFQQGSKFKYLDILHC
jgi:hypothetical protein